MMSPRSQKGLAFAFLLVFAGGFLDIGNGAMGERMQFLWSSFLLDFLS